MYLEIIQRTHYVCQSLEVNCACHSDKLFNKWTFFSK